MAARTGARTGLSPPALASDSSALDHSATEGTKIKDNKGGQHKLPPDGSIKTNHCSDRYLTVQCSSVTDNLQLPTWRGLWLPRTNDSSSCLHVGLATTFLFQSSDEQVPFDKWFFACFWRHNWNVQLHDKGWWYWMTVSGRVPLFDCATNNGCCHCILYFCSRAGTYINRHQKKLQRYFWKRASLNINITYVKVAFSAKFVCSRLWNIISVILWERIAQPVTGTVWALRDGWLNATKFSIVYVFDSRKQYVFKDINHIDIQMSSKTFKDIFIKTKQRQKQYEVFYRLCLWLTKTICRMKLFWFYKSAVINNLKLQIIACWWRLSDVSLHRSVKTNTHCFTIEKNFRAHATPLNPRSTTNHYQPTIYPQAPPPPVVEAWPSGRGRRGCSLRAIQTRPPAADLS